jgi:hypothetical protein
MPRVRTASWWSEVGKSERKLSTDTDNLFKQPSTVLEPIPSELLSDVQPMPSGQFTEVVVPLYFEGHVYRAGSRLRVTIAAPNGAQPGLVLRRDPATDGHVDGFGGVPQNDAVEPRPAGGRRRERGERPAALPEPAQRAVPPLCGVRERHGHRLTRLQAATRVALRRSEAARESHDIGG